MIKRSSNLATNILIELADPDSIAAMLEEFGAQGMKVLRGVEDTAVTRRAGADVSRMIWESRAAAGTARPE